MLRLTLLLALFQSIQAYAPPMDCDMRTEIGPGQTLTIPAFPPKEPHGGSGQGSHGPRECTWTFRAVGHCSPKFITTGYENKDPDCGRQYFLIGDERSEERVCGFKKPAAALAYQGRQLFLTHFQQRNIGYDYETGTSVLSGVVHCRKLPNTAPCSCSQVQLPGSTTSGSCQSQGDCDAVANFTIGTTTKSLRVSCSTSSTSSCGFVLARYSAVVALNQSCVAPLPAIPESEGICTTGEMSCPPSEPSCSIAIRLEAQSILVYQTTELCSFVSSGVQCTLQFQLCLTP